MQNKKRDSEIDVSLITNGVVTVETLDKLITSCIDRINVSLHGFDFGTFKKITGGNEQQFNNVFETIQYFSSKKLLVKINYVLLKGINEAEFFNVLEYVHENNFVLDVLNYLDDDLKTFEQYHYDFLEIESMIQKKYAVSDVKNFDNRYSIPSMRMSLVGGGTINLKVNELKHVHFFKDCEHCNKKASCNEGIAAIRLTSEGIVKPCIFRDDNCFDLIGCLRERSFDRSVQALSNYLDAL